MSFFMFKHFKDKAEVFDLIIKTVNLLNHAAVKTGKSAIVFKCKLNMRASLKTCKYETMIYNFLWFGLWFRVHWYFAKSLMIHSLKKGKKSNIVQGQQTSNNQFYYHCWCKVLRQQRASCKIPLGLLALFGIALLFFIIAPNYNVLR